MKNNLFFLKHFYLKVFSLSLLFSILYLYFPSFSKNLESNDKFHRLTFNEKLLGNSFAFYDTRKKLIEAPANGLSVKALSSIDKVEKLIQVYLSSGDINVKLTDAFSGSINQKSSVTDENISSFLNAYRNFSIDKIQIELRKSEDLFGSWAVFAAQGHRGKPVIYLNEKASLHLSEDQLVNLILEEIGHWIDFKINGSFDTPGYEGQLFAALVQNGTVSDSFRKRLLEENDHLSLTIEGQEIQAELASIIFSTAGYSRNAFELSLRKSFKAKKKAVIIKEE